MAKASSPAPTRRLWLVVAAVVAVVCLATAWVRGRRASTHGICCCGRAWRAP